MQKDFIKQWLLLNEKAQGSFQKINSLHTESIKKLSQLQMDMMASCLEGGVEKSKKVSELKSITELFELQASLYQQWSENILDSAQSSIQVAMSTKQAMSDLLNESLAAENEEKKEVPIQPVVKAKSPARRAPVKAKPAPKKVANKVIAKPVTRKAAIKPKPVAKKAVNKPEPVTDKVTVKPATRAATIKPKPVAKKAVNKPEPVTDKVTAKPAARAAVIKPKPVVKTTVNKPELVANKVTDKPITTKVATKPAPKKPVARQVANKVVTNPVVKK